MAGKIAVIGLGLMGTAAAERLVSKGYEVYAWSRNSEKVKELAGKIGFTGCSSPSEALREAGRAILFLADDAALLSVIKSLSVKEGVVVNSSTVTPEASIEAGRVLSSAGLCYLEAPVIGGPDAVRSGSLVTLVAGPRECYERVKDVVDSLSKSIHYLGSEYGVASGAKLAFNSLLMVTLAGLAEAMLLAEAYGVKPSKLGEILGDTILSGVASRYIDRMTSKSWRLGFKIELAAKDMEYASRAAYNARTPSLLIKAASELFKLAATKCRGRDYARIYWYLKMGDCRDIVDEA